MSYDIKISEEGFNLTYNVSPMFYAAIPERGIRAIYGETGLVALKILRDLREYFENNVDKLKAMEPDNGWGTFENTYKCICKIILASVNNPNELWSGD